MRKPSVKINILYQMLYEVLALALPLITTPYISYDWYRNVAVNFLY